MDVAFAVAVCSDGPVFSVLSLTNTGYYLIRKAVSVALRPSVPHNLPTEEASAVYGNPLLLPPLTRCWHRAMSLALIESGKPSYAGIWHADARD